MSLGISSHAQTGINSGLARSDQAAHNIASQSTLSSSQNFLSDRPATEANAIEPQTKLTDSLVDLKQAEQEVAANAKVMRQGDEMLGSLIDIFA